MIIEAIVWAAIHWLWIAAGLGLAYASCIAFYPSGPNLQVASCLTGVLLLCGFLGMAAYFYNKNLCYYYQIRLQSAAVTDVASFAQVFAVKYSLFPVAGVAVLTVLVIWWTKAWERPFKVLLWFSTPILVFIGTTGGLAAKTTCGVYDVNSEWTTTTKIAVNEACERSVVQSQDFTRTYATTYCQCIYGQVFSRWSYSEYAKREQAIISTLVKEGVIAACLREADKPQSAKISSEANSAGMPDGVFGVRLGSSSEEVIALRKGVKEKNGSLEEQAEWLGRRFKILYAVSPFSKTVMLIELSRPSNIKSYLATNADLRSQYGPFTEPVKIDQWLLKSERVSGGILIIHGLSNQDSGVITERILIAAANG